MRIYFLILFRETEVNPFYYVILSKDYNNNVLVILYSCVKSLYHASRNHCQPEVHSGNASIIPGATINAWVDTKCSEF